MFFQLGSTCEPLDYSNEGPAFSEVEVPTFSRIRKLWAYINAHVDVCIQSKLTGVPLRCPRLASQFPSDTTTTHFVVSSIKVTDLDLPESQFVLTQRLLFTQWLYMSEVTHIFWQFISSAKNVSPSHAPMVQL